LILLLPVLETLLPNIFPDSIHADTEGLYGSSQVRSTTLTPEINKILDAKPENPNT
jgi:hypothetical protein